VRRHSFSSSNMGASENADFKSQWKFWAEEAEKNKKSGNAWMNGRGKVLRAPKKETPRDRAAEEETEKAVAQYEKIVRDGTVEEINKAMSEFEKSKGELAKAANEWEKASGVKKWMEPESER
jgi:hypothetical protein